MLATRLLRTLRLPGALFACGLVFAAATNTLLAQQVATDNYRDSTSESGRLSTFDDLDYADDETYAGDDDLYDDDLYDDDLYADDLYADDDVDAYYDDDDDPYVADKWWERSPYYNEDEWYDPTDWFDGNNYELDWDAYHDDYGYDATNADDDWYYDYYGYYPYYGYPYYWLW
jgi:hypothetical protein